MKLLIDMPVEPAGLAELKQISGLEIALTPEPSEAARPLPEELIAGAEMFFGTCLPSNHRAMAALKVIQIASAGYTQLLDCDLNIRGIRACNAAGVQDIPIAEWNLAMMINLRRDLPAMMRNQAARAWDRDSRFQREIRGLTVGIWGYGGIGRQTARLAKALGLTVHVMTSDGRLKSRADCYCVPGSGDPEGIFPDRVFAPAAKKEFLGGLDFLILSVPLTPGNRGMIGRAELAMLPPHAFILNPARGPLIEEQPLIEALRQRSIAGAALDTHYYYPLPPGHPLWEMDNVILTPHISGSSGSTRFLERIWEIWVENVRRRISGRPLLNELSPAQLDGK